MTERQLIVKPIGLVTQPNQKGQYPPGALATAVDIVMRNPGDIQQAYAKSTFVSTLGSTVYGITTTGQQLVRWQRSGSATWLPSWVSSGGTANDGSVPSTSYLELSQVGRLQGITFRDRHIVTTENGSPLVADYASPTSSTERAFRFAGLQQCGLSAFEGSVGNAIAPSTAVNYAVVVKRTFADGYVVQGPPSLVCRLSNGSATDTINGTLLIYFSFAETAVGDVLELYRTQGVPTAADAGATLYLVKTYTLTSSDRSNGFVSLDDTAAASTVGGALGGLGEELYTNPRFGGLDRSYYAPPVASCIASFRGRAWYGNCKFPASINLAMRGGFGTLGTALERTYGVGRRQISGTFTNGSNTITGISATHILGLSVGQQLQSLDWSPTFPTITSVGATSITVSSTYTASTGASSVLIDDLIELDGAVNTVRNLFPISMQGDYVRTSTRTFSLSTVTTNQSLKISSLRYEPPATLTIRATSGTLYDPPLPAMSAATMTVQPTHRKNYLQWSEDQLPESVPPTNETYVGSGEIYALVPTRDALWAFCSDGLFRISGTVFPINGIPDVRVDPVDPNCILAGPRAWCVLRDRVYALTNQGFVEVSDNGVRELSTGIVGDLIPGQVWAEAQLPFLVADERLDEVWVMQASPLTSIVYSARYNCFTSTTQFASSTHGLYLPWSRGPAFTTSAGVVDHIPASTTDGVANATADFQPLYGDRPDVLKQWVDLTFMVVPATALGATSGFRPRFGQTDIDSSLAEQLLDAGADQRVTYGISRDVPAVATTIRPGLRYLAAAPTRLSGISLRYVPITEQESIR